jgi:hypothetical protein
MVINNCIGNAQLRGRQTIGCLMNVSVYGNKASACSTQNAH